MRVGRGKHLKPRQFFAIVVVLIVVLRDMPSRLPRGGFAFLDPVVRAWIASWRTTRGTESPYFPPQLAVGSISVPFQTAGGTGSARSKNS